MVGSMFFGFICWCIIFIFSASQKSERIDADQNPIAVFLDEQSSKNVKKNFKESFQNMIILELSSNQDAIYTFEPLFGGNAKAKITKKATCDGVSHSVSIFNVQISFFSKLD